MFQKYFFIIWYEIPNSGKNRREHLFSPPLSFAPSRVEGVFSFYTQGLCAVEYLLFFIAIKRILH